MYNSTAEVIAKIREVYKDARSLSKRFDGLCTYGDSINGLGCAIGCLLPKDIRDGLDAYHTNKQITQVYYYYLNVVKDSPKHNLDWHKSIRFIFEEIFNMNNITIDQLDSIQKCHDLATSIDNFILLLYSIQSETK